VSRAGSARERGGRWRARDSDSVKRRDFNKLWAGQTTSLLGDQVVLLALPLLAVTVLGVSAAEAALLRFTLFVPFLLFGLLAGPIVDRLPRRAMLIGCDIGQVVCYVVIATLAAMHALSFALLVVLIAISGTAIVFFQIAYSSYVPQMFSDPDELHSGNAKLCFSESVAITLGPAVAGPLVAIMGPATAMLVNAASFVTSVASLIAIRTREPRVVPPPRARGWMRKEIEEGLRFVFAHPLLQPVFLCGSIYVLFLSIVQTSIVLYCHGVLHLSTGVIGIVVGAAAAGFPIGNIVSGRLLKRYGMPRTLVGGAIVSVTGLALLPLAGAMGSVVGLIAASILHGTGDGTFGPAALTLRQTVTSPQLLGRVNSVQRFLLWGAAPIGSLLAAAAIALVGLQGTMWIGGVGASLCLVPLLRRGILAALRSPSRGRLDLKPDSPATDAVAGSATSHQ
jgi:MFS family permease